VAAKTESMNISAAPAMDASFYGELKSFSRREMTTVSTRAATWFG
jgi:hypothetical protein